MHLLRLKVVSKTSTTIHAYKNTYKKHTRGYGMWQLKDEGSV